MQVKGLKNKADQILDVVTSWIRDGEIGVGDKLPSERELAQQFGVSLPTINKAMSRLEDLSLVSRTAGLGTHVTSLPPQDAVAVVCDIVRFGTDASLHASNTMMDGLIKAAEARQLTPHFLIGRGEETEQFIESLGVLSGIWNSINGVVAWGWRPGLEEWFLTKGIQLVTISSWDQGNHQVLFSYMKLGEMAGVYLSRRCHENVAVIHNFSAHQASWNNPLPTFDMAMRKGGFTGNFFFVSAEANRLAGYRCGEQMSRQLETCDGIFITNDLIASGFSQWMEDHPDRVRPEIPIISHANKGISTAFSPQIVRLEFDLERLSEAALSHLSDLMYGQVTDAKSQIWIEPDLVVEDDTTAE